MGLKMPVNAHLAFLAGTPNNKFKMTVTVRWEEKHYSQVLQDDNIFNFNAEFPEISRRDNLLFKIQFSESLLHPQIGPIRYLIFKDLYIDSSVISIISVGGNFHLPIPQTDFLCNISTMSKNMFIECSFYVLFFYSSSK